MKYTEQTLQDLSNYITNNPTHSYSKISLELGIPKPSIQNLFKRLEIKHDRKEFQKLNNGIRSKPEIELTETTYQVILGSILGDGTITKNYRGKNSSINKNSALEIKHSTKQSEYLLYKKQLLDESVASYISYRDNISEISGRKINTKCINLKTKQNLVFNQFRDNFYNTGIKKVTNLVNDLEGLGLAIWFMDDGSKHTSGYYLHTNGFDIEDLIYLQKLLKDKFDIETSIHKANSGKVIYIKNKSVKKFNLLIMPYMHPTMMYKILKAA